MKPTWIFGYGSIIWKPDFPFQEQVFARANGYARRFFQKSLDHRGLPHAPGRVVTLVPEPSAHCWGVAFKIPAAEDGRVLRDLDQREQGGYCRRTILLQKKDGATLEATSFIAEEGNPYWWGPADVETIAATVRVARGPSGTNEEYVLRLAEALRAAQLDCPHTFAIEAALLRGAPRLQRKTSPSEDDPE